MGKQTFIAEKSFLVLPVSEYVGGHRVTVERDGMVVDDFQLRLDYEHPMAYSLYPLARFHGSRLTFRVEPDMDIQNRQTNEPKTVQEDKNGEAFRPAVHFTAPYGWINDPNGLVCYTSPVTGETVYHMFYQYNPYDWVWGNMHWGHAVSPDLLHWTVLPPALEPDENGTMFSGSAVVDTENRSGLQTGEEPVLLLFYTCAGGSSGRSAGKPFTQCMAYSVDGGKTFRKYEKNPVVPHILGGNRDPKVIWCEELQKFVMALYLDGSTYALLTSDNLLAWEELQRLTLDGDGECPDFYPLSANGDPSKRRWIFSGAGGHYMVGIFEDGHYRILQASRPFSSGVGYAAQTFSGMPDGSRVQIAWDREVRFGPAHFASQMSIPHTLTLRETVNGYALCAQPYAGLETLAKDEKTVSLELKTGHSFTMPLKPGAYRLDITVRPEDIRDDVRMTVFGQTIILLQGASGIRIGRQELPFDAAGTVGTEQEITLFIDTGSAEVFAPGGRAVLTVPWLLNFNHARAEISVAGENRGITVLRSVGCRKLEL